MRWVTLSFIFLLGLMFQMTWLHLPGSFMKVDVVGLLVIYLGFTLPLFPGGFFVLLFGLALETVLQASGILTLSYLVLYLLLRMAQENLFLEGAFARTVWVILLTLLQKVMFLLGRQEVGFNWSLLVLTPLMQGAVSLLFFPWLEKVFQRGVETR